MFRNSVAVLVAVSASPAIGVRVARASGNPVRPKEKGSAADRKMRRVAIVSQAGGNTSSCGTERCYAPAGLNPDAG